MNDKITESGCHTVHLDAAVHFLKSAHGGRRIYLNALPRHAGKAGDMVGANFGIEQEAEMREWIVMNNAQQACLYWMPNQPRMPRMRARESDIEFIRWAYLDIDPLQGESADSVQARVRKAVLAFRLAPTFVICSGNGVQLFWRLRATDDDKMTGLGADLRIGTDPERMREAREINNGLIQAFGGKAQGADDCYSVEHLYRVPGTINWKRKDGRSALPCYLLDDLCTPEASYEPGEFPRHPIAGQRISTQAQSKIGSLGQPLSVGTDELQQWAATEGATLPDRPLALIATGDASAWAGNRSAMVFYVCGELLRAGVPGLLVASAIHDKANPISAHVHEKGGRTPWAYAQRQVNRALDDNAKRATDSGGTGRDAIEAARRAHQVEENRRIGQGAATLPPAELIALDAALTRFVFCADGSRVVDVFNPHYDLPLHDWQATYAASKVTVARPPKALAGGGTKDQEPASVPLAKVWMSHPERRTVVTRTFKAGGPLVLPDPGGRLAVNSWRPFDRSLTVADLDAAGLGLFLDHVAFLFGDDAPRLLDWLAHIEQKPGELPHTSWLHIARKFGMGRNWLASVLTRVWAGSVAPNFDLVASLKSGFNGGLSRKVLAVVDEIREGGRDAQWEHSEKMKGLITEETRTINPKYGRQSVEFNACRWLLFSNHLSAIPMENGDRRIEVVVTEAMPRPTDYYMALYRALHEPTFIAAVATFLGQRDLSTFNPGAHARLSEAKREAIQASQSPDAYWAELIATHWPCDVAPNKALAAALAGDADSGGGLLASQRRALQAADIVALGGAVRLADGVARMSVIRGKPRWKAASGDEVRAEWERGEVQAGVDRKGWAGWRQYLLGRAAKGGDSALTDGSGGGDELPF